MARRTRSSRAWHFVLSGVRHEADSRAVALASGARGWGYDSDGQVGGCWGRSTARQGELPSPSIPTPRGCVTRQLVLQHAAGQNQEIILINYTSRLVRWRWLLPPSCSVGLPAPLPKAALREPHGSAPQLRVFWLVRPGN